MVTYDVLIPALNEDKTIHDIISKWNVDQVNSITVLVDDKTTDETEKWARLAGANVYRAQGVCGKGQLITSALTRMNSDYIALCDGDYDEFPERAVQLVAPRNPLNHRMRIVVPRFPSRLEWANSGAPMVFDGIAWGWMCGLRSFPAHMVKGCEFHGFLTETQINKAAARGNYLTDIIYCKELHAPLRFTEERLRKMESDRRWGLEHGVFDRGI